MLSFGFSNKKIVSDLDGSPFNAVVEGMQVLGGGAGGQVVDIEGVAASKTSPYTMATLAK